MFKKELLVIIKGMGEIKVGDFGTEKNLAKYVLAAYNFLKEDDSPELLYDPDEFAENKWKVIRFSKAERVLEVEKIVR